MVFMATGMIEGTFHVGGLTSMKKVFAKNPTDQNVFLIFLKTSLMGFLLTTNS